MGQESLNPEVKYWNDQIGQARKREKEFRRNGRRIVALYEAEKKEEHQFNILYSNTETLAPALYNNTPRPVVERRYKDSDPLGKLSAKVCQRILEFLVDSGDRDYSDFDDMAKQAVLEALLPGRGVTRFKYDAEFEQVHGAALPTMESGADTSSAQPQPVEQVAYETVCGEEVPWDRILFGYAKKWKDVPWIAFEHFFSKEELVDNFGAAAASIPLSKMGEETSEDEDASKEGAKDAEGEMLAHVYEIWHKKKKRVVFIADGYGEIVKSATDPLALSGFYSIPKPMAFFAKVSSLCPKALYELYEEQAKELNTVTVRINKIVKALKVRGFYDSTLEGLDELMSSPDNTLLPATNVSSMLQGQTLEKAIWLMPIEKLVTVLNQLYAARTEIKQTIYEISGIADVMRGASKASETLGAQKLKSEWGSLRIKRGQKEVQRYIRDCLRIMAEIAVTKLSIEKIAAMTGMQLPRKAQQAQAQAIVQQMALEGREPPPEIASVLQSPTWEDVMSVLQDDLQRNYRIDIETNSTVDIEATEDKEQVGELLNALAQFMNGIMPVVEQGIMSFDAAKAMLLTITRRFRFGTEVEDQINAMQAPPPKTDPKAEAEAAQVKLDMEAAQQKAEIDRQTAEIKLQIEREKLELEKQKLALERQKMTQQLEFSQVQHAQKMRQSAAQAALQAEIGMQKQAQAAQAAPKGESNANV